MKTSRAESCATRSRFPIALQRSGQLWNRVVWATGRMCQDPLVFASIQGVMVIDGLDPAYLHVQEISPDSTWQPVIPTP